MKSKAHGRPGALKETLLKEPTPMHSSAKSPGLPAEIWDERPTQIQMRGSWARAATNTQGHKDHIYTEAQTSMESHTFMHATCSAISSLPHCPVSQDVFF